MELIVSMNAHSPRPTPVHPSRAPPLCVDLVDQIGSGRASGSAVAVLADAQLALTRALLVSVADVGGPLAGAGLAELARLEHAAPDAVMDTLAHPYLRMWAIEALRKAGFGQDDASGYLSCVAAAAAVRAGIPAELTCRSAVAWFISPRSAP